MPGAALLDGQRGLHLRVDAAVELVRSGRVGRSERRVLTGGHRDVETAVTVGGHRVLVAPACTVFVDVNSKSLMVMSALPEPADSGLELLLHAATERPRASTTRTRIAKREREEREDVL